MDGVGSSAYIAFGKVVDKGWDIDIYWAGSHAAWVLAVEATCSLQECLLLVIAVAYLLEVGSTHLWVLFAHCDTWYLIRHSIYIYVRGYRCLISPDSYTSPGDA